MKGKAYGGMMGKGGPKAKPMPKKKAPKKGKKR